MRVAGSSVTRAMTTRRKQIRVRGRATSSGQRNTYRNHRSDNQSAREVHQPSCSRSLRRISNDADTNRQAGERDGSHPPTSDYVGVGVVSKARASSSRAPAARISRFVRRRPKFPTSVGAEFRSEVGPNGHKPEFEFELDLRESTSSRATVGPATLSSDESASLLSKMISIP